MPNTGDLNAELIRGERLCACILEFGSRRPRVTTDNILELELDDDWLVKLILQFYINVFSCFSTNILI